MTRFVQAPDPRGKESAMADERQEIVDTVARLFAAAQAEDLLAFQSSACSDFFIYENGKRFDSAGIFQLIVDAQRAGAVFEWHIVDPIAYIEGNLASVAYVNRGAVTRGGDTEPVTWFETATLTRDHGGWRVAFMSSMRTSIAAPRDPAKDAQP
jgi:hypothetical protein